MPNKTQNKSKETISFSNLPSIIVVVIFIVGIGAVFGLLGYLVSGIKENITPVAQKPSIKITDGYFGNNFIQVKSPQKNTVVKNPVLISGKANVDEANVRIKITDANENILADTFITADGWMDKLHPFKKEINYKTPQTENGLIEIFEESARDGSEIYKVEIPVVFEDYEDKAISHPECSDNNPPSVYNGGKKTQFMSVLNLCGKKTEFSAYEFEKENFILFIDKKNDSYEQKNYSLKIISTKYPFEEKVLSDKISDSATSFSVSDLLEEKGLYFWGDFACCPGSYSSIFMFEPKSKDFVYFSRKVMSDVDIDGISSKSSVAFNAKKKARFLLGDDDCVLSDDDIEVIVNNEKLSKKDVDDGHSIENQEAIFSCQPLEFVVPEDNYYKYPDHYTDNYGKNIERGRINIRKYIGYFPDKFPCFVNKESDEITGYFDLIKNKFVSVSLSNL